MTVPSTVNRNDYVGNGATSVYDFTYYIFDASDLLVTTRSTLGVETTLALTTNYTVSINQDSSTGGTITLVAGNLASGVALTIRRVRPLTQETDIRNQGSYFPEIHEDAYDHLMMICHQLDDALSRSLRLQETEAGTAAKRTLPSLADRANAFLAFDASGNPVAATGVAGVPTSIFSATLLVLTTAAAWRTALGISLTNLGVSAYIQTLLDDVDAATARGTLGVTMTNLGISAFMQTVLDDTTSAAARATLEVTQANLGISAFIQTLMDDTDAATARNTLGVVDSATQSVEQAGPTNLGVAGDTLIAGLTLTPAAGIYEVDFNGQVDTPGVGGNQIFTIYKNGVAVTDSIRTVSVSSAFIPISTSTKVTVNGSEAIDVRWSNSAGTATLQRRRLKIQKVSS